MQAMHSEPQKILRQNLLAKRIIFAADPDASILKDRLLILLNQFLSQSGKEIQTIALYWPIRGEIDLRATLISWSKCSPARQLALPVVREDKHLDFYTWKEGDPLSVNIHGISEPDINYASTSRIIPDCIFIPCVGWSSTCEDELKHVSYWRLGYGGGYFDRTLRQLRNSNPSVLCIGVGFDFQKLDITQWRSQEHDESLYAMLTESGFYS